MIPHNEYDIHLEIAKMSSIGILESIISLIQNNLFADEYLTAYTFSNLTDDNNIISCINFGNILISGGKNLNVKQLFEKLYDLKKLADRTKRKSNFGVGDYLLKLKF